MIRIIIGVFFILAGLTSFTMPDEKPQEALVTAAAGTVLGAISIFSGVRARRSKRRLQAQPTSAPLSKPDVAPESRDLPADFQFRLIVEDTLFPGEQILHKTTEDARVSGFDWSRCAVVVTNRRIMLVPPAETRWRGIAVHNLDCYYRFFELDDLRSVQLADHKIQIHFRNGIEPCTISGTRSELPQWWNPEIGPDEDRGKLLSSLNKALSSKRELKTVLFFEDPGEKVLFKTGREDSRLDYCDDPAFEKLWKPAFERSLHSLSAGAKLCITNKRLFFYRINCLQDLTIDQTFAQASCRLGPPDLQSIQIPLSCVSRISLEKSPIGIFGMAREPHLTLTLAGFEPKSNAGGFRIPALLDEPKSSIERQFLFLKMKHWSAPKVVQTLCGLLPTERISPEVLAKKEG